ncbi:hypothetical protein DU57_14210 [Methanosarcina mazei]|jgi:hypothetical protein|uniref:PD-(D/E)XK nuclease family protein n=2 Tax=Methanosarcina mazei TaxID=2209 RepID=A0A0F8KV41_METMZ|nr:PD-(D/E)XK nuclease family protein [Methanosarcina mazei]AKB67565.1 hypothetical protein MSMAL_1022 [Methanosarcina mazei LYC]KKG84740.1 hypothetical protein DU57_14210 [Methanosarcina mazei]KKG94732.1 hypothetical protein DU59_10095 [Methanosarcina mazei]KKH07526.1 hypothetical protein DU42_14290 [Methanosarcina mazei]QIB90563.1 PD-(D/E)XK nuclease family protein [Methanosarcina mazei]
MSTPCLLPPIPPINPIKKISPTRFIELKSCYLKGVWGSNNYPPLLPASPHAIIGKVIHEIMEYVGKGNLEINESSESFDEKWNSCIKREETKLTNSWFEKHLTPLSTSVKNYDEKKELCRLTVESSFKYKNQNIVKYKPSVPIKCELWLRTHDKICVGKADCVKVSDSFVEIVDYKSTETVDPKKLKEYSIQLKLYCALYHETYGTWPSSLKVMLINNKQIEVRFTKEECENLLKDTKKTFFEVNDIISTVSETKNLMSKLASPSPEACHFCDFRPVCTPYWEERKSSPKELWPSDLKGKLVRKKPWGKKRVYIEVEMENKEMVKVVDLLPERHPALEILNYEIAIFSLNKNKKNPRIFHEGQLTVVYLTP